MLAAGEEYGRTWTMSKGCRVSSCFFRGLTPYMCMCSTVLVWMMEG